MSVPPQLIRVKRKATDESPVSFLRVQENKRHRSETFVYRRQEENPKLDENIPTDKPIIHTSQPHTKTTSFQSPETPKTSTDGLLSDPGANHLPTGVISTETTSDGPATSEPRKFRMSRSDMRLAASQITRAHGGITKKRSTPALFVERKIKHISARPHKKAQALANASAALAIQDMEVDKPAPRKMKKPGVSKFPKNKKENDQAYKADVPKSMTNRWNVDMDKLTTEMNAYAMEQIGLNIQKVNDEKVSETPAKNRLKFKPKHITRYAERHPETAQIQPDVDMMDTDVDMSDSDDGDYIIETYERVPASKLGEHVPAHTVGLIVFDEDPELEFFYGDNGDSDVEWAEDEEDENAENYYAADYPEDEVASDDEFGHNPYSFRNGNASDLEEYDLNDEDEDDAALSGEEDETGFKSNFKAYVGRAGRPNLDDSEGIPFQSRRYLD